MYNNQELLRGEASDKKLPRESRAFRVEASLRSFLKLFRVKASNGKACRPLGGRLRAEAFLGIPPVQALSRDASKLTGASDVKAFLLVLLLSAIPSVAPASVFSDAKRSIVSVSYTDEYASCGGVAVDGDSVRTALHCLVAPGNGRMYFNGKLSDYTVEWVDERLDQIQVQVEGAQFKHPAKFGPTPAAGDEVFMWGNPGGYESLLRRGYFEGIITKPYPWKHDSPAYVYEFDGYPGDSGHPIFNMRGQVVGITSQKITETTKQVKEEPLDYNWMMFDFVVSYKTDPRK
jgi:S1-C subfamily serine protease